MTARAASQAVHRGDKKLERLLVRMLKSKSWRIDAETHENTDDLALSCGKRQIVLRPAAPGAAAAARIPVDMHVLRQACRAQLIERDDHDGLTIGVLGLARLKRDRLADDGFRRQHQLRGTKRFARADGPDRVLEIDHKESPLAWLHKRKGRDGGPMIDAQQFEAGERLRADATFGRIGPGLAKPSWQGLLTGATGGGRNSGGLADLTDAAMAARSRVEKALKEVGPELSGVLIDVCCDLCGLEQVEKARGWPPRTGKIVLSLALTALARHYGLLPRDRVDSR